MQPGKSPRRRARTASIVAAAAMLAALASALSPSGALAPAAALAALARPSDGALSPRLAELAKPALRTAPPAKQAQALSLAAEGPGSLVRDGNRVLVEVRFDHGAAAGAADLRRAGAQVVNVSRQYQTVTVAARPDELAGVAAIPNAMGAKEVLAPLVASGPECPSGLIVSEGDQQLRAAEARAAHAGITGTGVTVGILSDSFAQAESPETSETEDVESGDLPGMAGAGNPCGDTTSVDVLEDIEEPEEGEDEGRAMAQIVHDLAPGAGLAFASAFNGEIDFAENIEKLAEPAPGGAEAKVITDDAVYPDEPFFQDGPVASAVNHVTADGVSYFSAAGNDNLVEETGPGALSDISSWEAPAFRDAGSCPTGTPSYATHCMDFDPGEGVDAGSQITVEPGSTLRLDLQWAQPWEGVTTDFDAYLLRGTTQVARSEYPSADPAIQEPFEFLAWENTSKAPVTVTLAIDRCNLACGVTRALAHPTELEGTSGGDAGSPRIKFALLQNGGGVESTEYPKSEGGDVVGPTIFGHTGTSGAISIAAVPSPAFPDFSLDGAEYYTSRGPVTHYFAPFVSGEAASSLKPAETLSKPDLAATDCGVTTFFGLLIEEEGGEPERRFCGTSAAAPHAAAVAALLLDEDEGAGPDEIRQALANGAAAVGSVGPCVAGAGLIDAVAAFEQLSDPHPVAKESCTAPASEPWEVIRTETTEPAPIPVAPDKEIPTSFSVQPIPPPPAPTTFFRKHPPKLILTRRHSVRRAFAFGSDQGAVSFLCKVDRGRFHLCDNRFVRRYRLGRHVLRVKARRNSDGATDATPAIYRFRVKRVRHGLIKRRHTRHHHRG